MLLKKQRLMKKHVLKKLLRKNRELESVKNKFKTQIDNLEKKNTEQKEKTKNAENRASLSKELIKCDMLLSNIESDYKKLKDSLKSMQKIYPEQVIEIERHPAKS